MAIELLQRQYASVAETSRGPDGAWFDAVRPDGVRVNVLAVAPELGAMIRDEARFFATLGRASLLRHDGLLGPMSWGRLPDGTLHIAFRHADAAPVATGGSTAAVAQMGRELLAALDVIHATGLAHGAIATRRVLLASTGHVLSEFGLVPALVAGGADPRAVLALVAEPPYVSPELQAGGVPDERSDIYSLGAVLYEVLTGKPPFGGRQTAFVLASVLADDGSEGGADSEDGNPVVDALLRAIEQAPDDRWPTAMAFSQALAAGIPQRAPAARESGRRIGCLPLALAGIGVGTALRLLA